MRHRFVSLRISSRYLNLNNKESIMTDNQIIEDHDVELHDEVTNEVVEANTHDPKDAEAQSVASGDAGPSAKKRGTDNTMQEPMPKTKAGIINAMYTKMNGMKKDQLTAAYGKMMTDDLDEDQFEGEAIAEKQDIHYQADFSEDLNALVNEEA